MRNPGVTVDVVTLEAGFLLLNLLQPFIFVSSGQGALRSPLPGAKGCTSLSLAFSGAP